MNISGPAAVAKPEMLFYAPGDLTVTIETFDNEHTVYTTVKIGDKEATLGTSEIPGQVTCYILVWEDAGVSCTIMGDGSLDELMKVAESIY